MIEIKKGKGFFGVKKKKLNIYKNYLNFVNDVFYVFSEFGFWYIYYNKD